MDLFSYLLGKKSGGSPAPVVDTGAFKVSSISEMNLLTGMKNGDVCVIEMTIPEDYTEISYIEGSGTQYIDTLYKPNQTKTEITFQQPNAIENSVYVAGIKDSADHDGARYFVCMYNHSNSKFVCSNRTGSNWPNLGNYNSNVNTVIYNDSSHYVYFNGTSKGTIETLTQETEYNLILFASNNQGTVDENKFVGKIYNCKITNNTTGFYERYLLPCKKNSDDEIGMYDIANDTFYSNSGTGDFTGGTTVTKTVAYTICEYVENTGWIFKGNVE